MPTAAVKSLFFNYVLPFKLVQAFGSLEESPIDLSCFLHAIIYLHNQNYVRNNNDTGADPTKPLHPYTIN